MTSAVYDVTAQVLIRTDRNVLLLHRGLDAYPDDCFRDPWHLNQYGAWRFSAEVGSALKQMGGTKNP